MSQKQRTAELVRERQRVQQLKSDLPSIIEDRVGQQIQKLETKLLTDFKEMGQKAIEQSTAVLSEQLNERIDTLESDDLSTDPLLNAERLDDRARFREAFAQLSQREQVVAVLLYVEERTLSDIGERLGVSESRVSQIHTELRGRLRERLTDEPLFTTSG